MQQLVEAFRESLQLALAQAKEADQALEQLAEENMAKFSAIFPKDSGFKVEANRITPYVEEIAMRFYDETQNGAKLVIHPHALTELASLLEKVFKVQHQFQQILTEQAAKAKASSTEK